MKSMQKGAQSTEVSDSEKNLLKDVYIEMSKAGIPPFSKVAVKAAMEDSYYDLKYLQVSRSFKSEKSLSVGDGETKVVFKDADSGFSEISDSAPFDFATKIRYGQILALFFGTLRVHQLNFENWLLIQAFASSPQFTFVH